MPIYRGDDVFWDIAIPSLDGTGPYDLRGCTVWVTAKLATSADVPDSSAAWQHIIAINSSGDVVESKGLTLGTDGADAGIVVEHLSAAESTLLATNSYRYDVQVKDAAGLITTIVSGIDTVVMDITRSTTVS